MNFVNVSTSNVNTIKKKKKKMGPIIFNIVFKIFDIPIKKTIITIVR